MANFIKFDNNIIVIDNNIVIDIYNIETKKKLRDVGIFIECNYKNDHRNGEYILYYKSERIKIKTYYNNNVEGKYIEYDDIDSHNIIKEYIATNKASI